jgi:hypothetical protein
VREALCGGFAHDFIASTVRATASLIDSHNRCSMGEMLADADVEPAAAQVIERADFLDETHRMVERQETSDPSRIRLVRCDAAARNTMPTARHRRVKDARL